MRAGTVVVLTGASRGFGRCLAVEMARVLPRPMRLVLIARDADGLRQTADLARRGGGDIVVDTCCLDLSDLDGLDASLSPIFDAIKDDLATAGHAHLFNNAASLGRLGPVCSSTDIDGSTATSRSDRMATLRKTIDLNVTSAHWLTSSFMSACQVSGSRKNRELSSSGSSGSSGSGSVGRGEQGGQTNSSPPSLNANIINVSSLAAVQPFPSWGMYCASKAANNMLNAVIAQEQAAMSLKAGGLAEVVGPVVKTLNYAPGPMDTDMQQEIRESRDVPADVRDQFVQMHADNMLVDPAESARRCVHLIAPDGPGFDSGSHVDYYDLELEA